MINSHHLSTVTSSSFTGSGNTKTPLEGGSVVASFAVATTIIITTTFDGDAKALLLLEEEGDVEKEEHEKEGEYATLSRSSKEEGTIFAAPTTVAPASPTAKPGRTLNEDEMLDGLRPPLVLPLLPRL